MEGKSNHPMASALVEYSRLNNIKPSSGSVKDFRLVPGEGISGDIDGNKISIGNRRMAQRLGCEDTEEDEKKRGTRMGYVVVNGVVAATFGVRDEYRSGSDQVIQELKRMGIKTVMLTGDSKVSAAHLQQSGNSKDFVHAELPPEGGKVSTIKDATKLGPTALVGDGMNEAPGLASASVRIAMGVSAFALATETSHVTLMSSDIGKIAVAIKLARKMKRKIVRNIMVYVVTKAVILGLAIAGHPLPWAAVLGDGGTTVLVNLNSTLLLLQQQEEQGHSHGVGGSSSKGDGCHKGCAPCGDHDKHHHKCEGTCKVESPCNSTSLGPSMEHAHMGCPSNCHPHCAIHDRDSTPPICHQMSCEESYCVKACTQVAMCRHLQTDVHVGAIPHAHTCESCHHMVMCEHAHEGKRMHPRGHGSTHQHSHAAIGDLEEVEVEGSEWAGQSEWSKLCSPRAGEVTFMNHGACETWYAEQEVRESRCCRSVCEPSEGVCIHGRPCLSEITVIESGLPFSLSVSSRYP